MAAAERRMKSAAMASAMKEAGIFHGRRPMPGPCPICGAFVAPENLYQHIATVRCNGGRRGN